MKNKYQEIPLTTKVEDEPILIEEISTEEVDSVEVDSMEVISAEIHFKVIPMVEVIIEEITETHERELTHIEIIITLVEETTFSTKVVILVENNHQHQPEVIHECIHLILG